MLWQSFWFVINFILEQGFLSISYVMNEIPYQNVIDAYDLISTYLSDLLLDLIGIIIVCYLFFEKY